MSDIDLSEASSPVLPTHHEAMEDAASAALIDRVISLHGIHNFRDYGGYAARDGARLKAGVLFRSGQHKDASADDLDAVAALDLQTVIDLRGDTERRLYPCVRPAGFTGTTVFAAGETAGSAHLAPHEEAAQGVVTAVDAHARMAALYTTMPFRPALVATLHLYFEALAARDGASLIHCLAGKDRTGVAVAVFHDLMGVHADDIMADYLLTNVAGNIERRIAAGAHAVRATIAQAIDDEAVRTIMSVHPEYLTNAFAAIRAQHGSVARYADAVLGVTAARRDQMAAQLLV